MNKNYIIKRQFFIVDNQSLITDKYKIIKEIGKGAFGTVFLAKEKIFPYKDRAIKAVDKRIVSNPTIVYNQIKILGRLEHPNIIKLFETFEDEHFLYLICDLCTGEQLYHRLAHFDNFNQNKAKELFKQMVTVISYLHSQNISHRDIKFQKSWQLKLIDFGQSFLWKKNMKDQLKNQKRLVGTAYYMSPELLGYQYDQKCDIWSLGVILYMMVTGNPPFNGDNQKQIMKSIVDYKFSLKTPQCSKLNPQLIDLMAKIFLPQNQRISLAQILNHSWIKNKQQKQQLPLKLDFHKLNIFAQFSKMKKIVSTQIASNLSQNEIKKLKKIFLTIDQNRDGYLSIEELQRHLKQNGKQSIDLEKLKILMIELDSDRNGKISYNQFLSSCIDESVILCSQYLQYCFKSFDLNSDGKIQKQQLNKILKTYKKEYACNIQLVQDLIKENDKNKDGQVDFMQFLATMKQIDVPQYQSKINTSH